jgi:DnaJ-class molecular chaperone
MDQAVASPPAPVNLDEVFEQFSDLFGSFFGRDGHVGVDLELTDDEAAAGVEREVAVARRAPCTACEGRGGARRGEPCTACEGRGRRQHTQGFFMIQASCERCHGRGALVIDPCAACDGAGQVTTWRTLVVRVPPGASHGQTLRLAGQGSPRPDGGVGDVQIYLLVGGRADPRIEAANALLPPAELPRATLRKRPVKIVPIAVGTAVLGLVLALLVLAR